MLSKISLNIQKKPQKTLKAWTPEAIKSSILTKKFSTICA